MSDTTPAKQPPIVVVASAKGGVGKTTFCVRVAEELSRRGIRTAIVDVAPYPAAHCLVAKESRVPVVHGRAATTPVAAKAMVAPQAALGAQLVMVDTGSVGDPALAPWLRLAHSLVLLTELHANSVNALPAVWSFLDRIRAEHPALAVLGLLSCKVQPEQLGLQRSLAQKYPQGFLTAWVGWDPQEPTRAQAPYALPPVPVPPVPREAWEPAVSWLAADFGLRAPERPAAVEAAGPTQGLLGKLWKLAGGLGRRVAAIPAGGGR
ncbi:MAG: P-loop NTPase [Candidatus Sumerlaeia bacterium]|nr:P-loop NTPase [Candidatus Sumerlaeia bacterium]